MALGFSEKALSILADVKGDQSVSRIEAEEIQLLRVEASFRATQSISLNGEKLEDFSIQNQPRFSYWLALKAIQEKEYASALETLIALSSDQTHPYHASILRNISRLYLELGNTEEAQGALGEIANKTDPKALFQKVEILLQEGKVPEAKAVLGQFSPTLKSAYKDALLGRMLYLEGELNEAKELFEGRQYSSDTSKGREATSLLSLIYSEEGNPKCLTLIKNVILQAESSEPVSAYFDQLLIATQKFPEEKEKTIKFLEGLSKRESFAVPYILFTKAQLIDDLKRKVELLHMIYTKYPQHVLAEKACYANAMLVSGMDDQKLRMSWLKRIARDSPSEALQTKVYTLIAEGAGDNLDWYAKAMKTASSQQLLNLKTNYNLALYESKQRGKSFLVSDNESARVLFEKALASKFSDPERAQIWLEEYFTKQKDHEGIAEAHLTMAELLLQSSEIETQKQAKAHLDTIDSLYLNELAEKGRFYEAKIRMALVTENMQAVNRLINQKDISPAVLFQIGYTLYNKGYPEQSGRVFLSLVKRDISPEELELAEYYAALSHFKIATEEYEVDSIQRFAKLTKSKQAKIRYGALHILAGYYVENANSVNALKYLKQLPRSLEKDLLEAKMLSLSQKKEDINRAASIYQKNYIDESLTLLKRYQIALQYSIFLKDNGKKGEALDLYYQIANFEVLSEPKSPQGWDIYRRIALKGVNLLETSGNWLTAYKFAQLLSLTNSPDKKVFLNKAKELSLEHILWDDDDY